VQLQPAGGGGGGVDVLAQGSERDLSLLKYGDDVDEVPQAAAQAGQAPDDERVAGQEVVPGDGYSRSRSKRQ
jgi:hypothetical protein